MPSHRHDTDLSDVLIEDEGTVCLLRLMTDRAEQWVPTHLEVEPYQRISGGIVVDHRHVPTIVEAMWLDGLDVVQV